MQTAWDKYHELVQELQSLKRVVVAFSGGVDSTFLLYASLEALGKENVLAITADSETYPKREREAAVALAKELGSQHLILKTSELAVPAYANNPANRCYICRNELFSRLIPIAQERGYPHVIFGAIADDLGDYRPGLQAAIEKGVLAPLQKVLLYKEEIRCLSKAFKLPTWDKPSMACLSSRIPYGERITQGKLAAVEKAEEFLSDLGFRQTRVRHHRQLARIEVPPAEIVAAARVAERIVKRFKELGFQYVTLDLQGFRSGSMNEILAGKTEHA